MVWDVWGQARFKALVFVAAATVIGLGSGAQATDVAPRGGLIERTTEPSLAIAPVIHILYDFFVERPWTETAYWAEAGRRWEILRASVCPRLELFCTLPTRLDSREALAEISLALMNPALIGELSAHLRAQGVAVEPVQNAHFFQGPFNFFVAKDETEHAARNVSIWSMRGIVRQRDFRNVEVFDIASYRGGFFRQWTPAHFGFAADGAVVINEDLILGYAHEYATFWRDRVVHLRGDPNRPLDGVLDAEDILVLKNFRSQARALGATDSDRVPDLAAFRAVVRDQLYGIVRDQAQYFALARSQRPHTGLGPQYTESVLHAATRTDPEFFALLLVSARFNPVLNLFGHEATKPWAGRAVLEMIQAALEVERFQSKGEIFRRFRGYLGGQLTRELDFLERHAPEALAAVRAQAGSRFADYVRAGVHGPQLVLENLPESVARLFFTKLLTAPDGTFRPVGFTHLANSLLSAVGSDDLKFLAERAHEVQRGFYVDGVVCGALCDTSI